jgi:hypothetical protein
LWEQKFHDPRGDGAEDTAGERQGIHDDPGCGGDGKRDFNYIHATELQRLSEITGGSRHHQALAHERTSPEPVELVGVVDGGLMTKRAGFLTLSWAVTMVPREGSRRDC